MLFDCVLTVSSLYSVYCDPIVFSNYIDVLFTLRSHYVLIMFTCMHCVITVLTLILIMLASYSYYVLGDFNVLVLSLHFHRILFTFGFFNKNCFPISMPSSADWLSSLFNVFWFWSHCVLSLSCYCWSSFALFEISLQPTSVSQYALCALLLLLYHCWLILIFNVFTHLVYLILFRPCYRCQQSPWECSWTYIHQLDLPT